MRARARDGLQHRGVKIFSVDQQLKAIAVAPGEKGILVGCSDSHAIGAAVGRMRPPDYNGFASVIGAIARRSRCLSPQGMMAAPLCALAAAKASAAAPMPT